MGEIKRVGVDRRGARWATGIAQVTAQCRNTPSSCVDIETSRRSSEVSPAIHKGLGRLVKTRGAITAAEAKVGVGLASISGAEELGCAVRGPTL